LMGSEFRICGAEILKPQDPNDKLYRGTVHLKNLDDILSVLSLFKCP